MEKEKKTVKWTTGWITGAIIGAAFLIIAFTVHTPPDGPTPEQLQRARDREFIECLDRGGEPWISADPCFIIPDTVGNTVESASQQPEAVVTVTAEPEDDSLNQYAWNVAEQSRASVCIDGGGTWVPGTYSPGLAGISGHGSC